MPLKRNIPESLIEANKAWNKFVEDNADWINTFNNKRLVIINDYDNGKGIITDTIYKERMAELIAENQPLSGEFARVRMRLMSQENLPTYKRELDKQNQAERPAPYWAKLIDEELEDSPFHDKTKRKVFLLNETVN
jgi:hypothetical protein